MATGVSTGVFGAVLLLDGLSAPPPGTPAGTDRPEVRRSWPLFGGTVHRNMANPFEKNIPATWDVEEKKNLKWVARLGSKAYGGPVVAGGRVFLGTNNEQPRDQRYVDGKGRPIDLGVLMCFRESDGQFLWQAVHPKLASGRVNDWPREGLVSMPAVEGRRLYYVSNRCELICADAEDGKAVWRLDMIRELGVFPHNLAICSPLLAGDLVFVVTGNGVDEGHLHVPAPQAPSFLAVHKRTGTVVWQDNSPTAKLLGVKEQGQERDQALRRLRDRGELLLHGQWSNPAYAEVHGQGQVIFPGGDGWLRAFEPQTGKLLWRFDCNPKSAVYRLGSGGTRSDLVATPAVYDGRLYIGVGQDPEHGEGVGHLWCIDLARAVEKGRTNKGRDVSPMGDNFDPAAAVNEGSAPAWHYGGPVRPGDRAKVGRNYHFGRTLSTCAAHGGLVYAAELAGHLHCLDAATGKVYWTQDTRAPTWGSPYYVDGKVYLGTEEGVMWVFAHGKEKRVLAENDMTQGSIRGAPVAVNGVLYITAENGLYAIATDR